MKSKCLQTLEKYTGNASCLKPNKCSSEVYMTFNRITRKSKEVYSWNMTLNNFKFNGIVNNIISLVFSSSSKEYKKISIRDLDNLEKISKKVDMYGFSESNIFEKVPVDILLDILNNLLEDPADESFKLVDMYTIMKNGKTDKNSLDSYRIIYRLPKIVNILHKILNNRLIEYIKSHNILDENIKGGISGISDPIGECVDRVNYVLHNKSDAFVCFVDIKKAYSTIKLSFVEKVLNYYKVPSYIITYIVSYYNNNIIAAEHCFCFKKNDGLMEGSPLSQTIFNLCINYILIEKMRIQSDFLGIVVYDQHIKYSAYIDDIVFFTDNGCEIVKMMSLFEDSLTDTGMKMSYEKTICVYNGHLNSTDIPKVKVINYNKVCGDFKYLGWYVSNSSHLSQMRAANKMFDDIYKIVEKSRRVTPASDWQYVYNTKIIRAIESVTRINKYWEDEIKKCFAENVLNYIKSTGIKNVNLRLFEDDSVKSRSSKLDSIINEKLQVYLTIILGDKLKRKSELNRFVYGGPN